MTKCPSCHQPSMVMGTSILTEISASADCRAKLKRNSTAHEMDFIPCQATNWYFKGPPGSEKMNKNKKYIKYSKELMG